MKRLLTFTLLAALAFPALAQTAPRTPRTPRPDGDERTRTIVVRDGRVVDLHPGDLLVAGKRVFLGVSPIEMTSELREHYGSTKDTGVLIGEVEANSPAGKAGVRVGDILIAIDGADVHSYGDIRKALRDKKAGDTVRVDVLRNKNRQTVVVTLAEREFPGMLRTGDLEQLEKRLNTTFNSPEWKASVERLGRLGGDCGELQSRIKELETRLKDLEKKLQK
ncbi:MAG TPA: PDZ domain-containing protein [Thermoanaerobaculia bacterium]|jgi:membrane-associated protease RseP (regulator of RpoE activity)